MAIAITSFDKEGGNEHSRILLVGADTGAAIMKNNIQAPQNIEIPHDSVTLL